MAPMKSHSHILALYKLEYYYCYYYYSWEEEAASGL